MDCAKCHNSGSWVFDSKKNKFNHSTTKFPLSGQHQLTNCKSCHTSLVFSKASPNCNSCHADRHSNSVGKDCARCHSSQSWLVDNITISKLHQQSSFPLIGVHASNDCKKCHQSETNISFKPIGLNCVDCHRKDFNTAKNPNHVKLKLSSDCNQCHTATPAWQTTVFPEHDKYYPLTGAHTSIAKDCNKCHIGGNFNNTPTECVGCHKVDFNKTTNPNHSKIGISTDCATCHTTTPSWKPAKFPNHNSYYALTGAHSSIANNCAACHKGNYNNTPNDCNSCHTNDFKKTTNPNHQTLGFSTDCASCHTTNPTWLPAKFVAHNNYYPLTGAHAIINCKQCHVGGNYTNTPKDCNSCHNTNYKSSNNPSHSKLNLSTDCASCHTTTAGWKPTTFNHNTYYPLTGAHANIKDCSACHKGDVKNTPKDCNSCHNANYKSSSNPSHSRLNLSTDCASCHTTTAGWKPTTFNHNTYYPLTGAHASIKDCSACHKGDVKNTPKDCNSCHNANYKASSNPNHSTLNLSTDCASCHTTTAGWKPTTFNHNTYYPLTGAHVNIKDCSACHKGDVKNTPKECNSCHNTNYKNSKNPDHLKLNLSTDCASCHSTKPGWSPASFPLHDTFFPLTGAHATVGCKDCHKNGTYANTPKDCNSCHGANYKASINPSHTKLNLSTDCASCHTTTAGWKPTTFNHNTYYPLTGAHANIKDCSACHKGDVKNTPKDCNSCHNANYKASVNPSHTKLNLSTECASCHTTTAGWKPTTFNHNAFYPLTGAHANIKDCSACHKGDVKNTPKDCNSCHNANYIASNNPSHSKLNLSTDCASCHTTTAGWKPTTFNHNTYYPLTGAHANIKDCSACHKGDVKNTPKDCNSCHNANYRSSSNPSHSSLNLSTDCASCHTTTAGWKPTTFNHSTYYPLTGAHANIKDCSACHKGDVKNTPKDCNSCHNANYRASSNPSHSTLNLSTDCASCHTTSAGWRPTTFNHNTYYPLTGAHANIKDCSACHKGDVKNTPKDCNSCHNANYRNAKNPDHVAANLSTDCVSCHTTNPGWRPSTFNHNVYYNLTGAHANIANNCAACHIGGKFKGTPTDCNSCHNKNYQAAQNPNHASGGFPTDCASCHTTNPGWRPSTFNHNVYYNLTGAHATIANNCAACHTGGKFKGTPTDCNSCHNKNYQASRNPNHVSAGFPTDCASCHNTNPGWKPSTFNHNAYYALTGAHATIANNCSACHSGGRFKGTPTDCNSCHSAKYNSSANPNHSSINLSRDCASCHTTNPGWRPSTFNHNARYALVGAHAAIASNCTSCHANGNYNHSAGCYSCHANKYNTASPNHSASHFPTSCTDCHNQNAWKPANWNHDASYFPIYSGAHKGKWNACTDCHNNSGNFAIFNCLNCHKKTDTDSHHKQVRNYSYDSNSCYSCHPRGNH